MIEFAEESRWKELTAAFERFVASASDKHRLPELEALQEALFAHAQNRGRNALLKLTEILLAHADRHPAIDAWLRLTRLHLADAVEHSTALGAVDEALGEAPPRTRWLVGAEVARLVWLRDGSLQAWERIVNLKAPPLAQDWQSEGPLVVTAILTELKLAAVNGAWAAYDELAVSAMALWTTDHPFAIRVSLALADIAISRGRYCDALGFLQRVEHAANGGLRFHLLCTKLHALVSLGRGHLEDTRAMLAAIRGAKLAAPIPGYELPAEEQSALERRLKQLELATQVSRVAEDTASTTLTSLLQEELNAQGIKSRQKRRDAMLMLVRRAESLLLRVEVTSIPEEWIRIQLLWCRAIVDLGDPEIFNACEDVLGQALAASTERSLAPLEMLALDQRAILRARKTPADFRGAVADSTRAASIAVELLAANTENGSSAQGLERSLLESLLPVLDRVVELHAEGALRIAGRHPELLESPLGAHSTARHEESPRDTWTRFGRVLHGFTEQIQALALQEARRSYEDGRMVPHRFAIAVDGSAVTILDDLRRALRPEDGVVQYLVLSRHVIVFAYSRRFFDWHIATVPDMNEPDGPDHAHRVLGELIRSLRGWTQGEVLPESRDSLKLLHSLLFPGKIDEAITLAGVQHLRIVPHDVLYRVPFGRIESASGPLLQRFSLSLHPTGKLAAESAAATNIRIARRPLLGYVVGPRVDCGAREEHAIRTGSGSVAPLARIEKIESANIGLAAIQAHVAEFDLLHLTCHGEEGSMTRSPVLSLADAEGGRIDKLPAVLRLPLRRVALVILQSCWSGWMDHERTNPVQGFPQAFCDAGACAVIAPLTQVHQALAPVFSNVFYRALRFLPAERALRCTLDTLRLYGSTLVADDPEARSALQRHGSMDAFEYRYTGVTGITVGGFVSRCIGWGSFFLWERRLRAAARRSKAALEPPL
jgi:hypothetical protein